MLGTRETNLIVLRGNSGSGKTTLARALQHGRGRDQVAVISQDVIRREVLWANDLPTNPAIGMIDLMARYALDQGLSVVVEGILHPERYGDMLRGLARDHHGTTLAYFWDLSFEETVRRHATKAKAAEFGEDEMREWWYGSAYVEGLNEATIRDDETLDAALQRVQVDCGWLY
jgi:predicted kinase